MVYWVDVYQPMDAYLHLLLEDDGVEDSEVFGVDLKDVTSFVDHVNEATVAAYVHDVEVGLLEDQAERFFIAALDLAVIEIERGGGDEEVVADVGQFLHRAVWLFGEGEEDLLLAPPQEHTVCRPVLIHGMAFVGILHDHANEDERVIFQGRSNAPAPSYYRIASTCCNYGPRATGILIRYILNTFSNL